MKRKVTFFIPSLRGGGAERVIITLANQFINHGCVVDLIASNAIGEYRSELSKNVNLIDLKCSRVIFSLAKLRNYINNVQPDILLSTVAHANIIAILANLIARKKCVVIIREANTLSIELSRINTFSGRIILKLTKALYPKANKIIAPSIGVAEDIFRNTNIKKELIHVIYNPINFETLHSKASEEINHPWFQSNSYDVILSVGRLTEQKDFKTLIRAFSILKNSTSPSAKLMILGEGKLREELETQICALKLENEVCLKGFVENPYPYMKHCACFVLSSKWEGSPNVLIQALSLGAPIVSTNCPNGPKEILDNGKWGKLVPIGDSSSLADSISKTLMTQHVDNTAIEYCRKKFSVDKIISQYKTLF